MTYAPRINPFTEDQSKRSLARVEYELGRAYFSLALVPTDAKRRKVDALRAELGVLIPERSK